MAKASSATADQDQSELVGPVLRYSEIAEAAIDAIVDDNPDAEVTVIDRGDYVRVHTPGECLLRQETLSKHMGEPFALARLEIEMPSFSGRMETRDDAYRWFLNG